jgi:hypothetical protein
VTEQAVFTLEQLHADAIERIDWALSGKSKLRDHPNKDVAFSTAVYLMACLTLDEYTLRRRLMAKWFGIGVSELDRAVKKEKEVKP